MFPKRHQMQPWFYDIHHNGTIANACQESMLHILRRCQSVNKHTQITSFWELVPKNNTECHGAREESNHAEYGHADLEFQSNTERETWNEVFELKIRVTDFVKSTHGTMRIIEPLYTLSKVPHSCQHAMEGFRINQMTPTWNWFRSWLYSHPGCGVEAGIMIDALLGCASANRRHQRVSNRLHSAIPSYDSAMTLRGSLRSNQEAT